VCGFAGDKELNEINFEKIKARDKIKN